MHGIYYCIPETNHVSRVYTFAGIVYLQFMLHAMASPVLHVVYFYVSTSLICVLCPIQLTLYFLDFALFQYVARVFSQ